MVELEQDQRRINPDVREYFLPLVDQYHTRGIYLGNGVSPVADGGSGHSSNVYQLNNNYDRWVLKSYPTKNDCF